MKHHAFLPGVDQKGSHLEGLARWLEQPVHLFDQPQVALLALVALCAPVCPSTLHVQAHAKACFALLARLQGFCGIDS